MTAISLTELFNYDNNKNQNSDNNNNDTKW